MIGFILAVALLALALLALALLKTYSALPTKELKRRARSKDPAAEVLYRAVAYGASLRLLLWLVVILAAAGSISLIESVGIPKVLAYIIVVFIVAYGFVWMPAHKATAIGVRLAVWTTPAVAWLLQKLHPVLDFAVKLVHEHRPVTVHTGLYDRDDLLALIESQKHQQDSRISTETLELLAHTLTFGDKLVQDCMVPVRTVREVSADEPVGPVIIKDLYDSGFSRFPVYKDSPDSIVGTLYLRDLVNLKHTGVIADVMQPTVNYVHEDHPLEQVLDAFIKTKHHLFIVVNSFEEFVGIITIEDIIEQILGCKIVDEFDQYDDIRAVAAHQAKIEHVKRQAAIDQSTPKAETAAEAEDADDEAATAGEKAGKPLKKSSKAKLAKLAPAPSEDADAEDITIEEIEAKEVIQRKKPDHPDGKNPYQQSTLKYLVYEAGFRGEALEIAYAVALAESAGKATAHNDNPDTGDDSYGLFQINMLGDMGPERRELYGLKTNQALFHPPTNVRVAYEISEGGKNWQPWSTYTSGAYKKFYNPKANAAITK
jgi:CBS domain containing-hemolysin-like protein